MSEVSPFVNFLRPWSGTRGSPRWLRGCRLTWYGGRNGHWGSSEWNDDEWIPDSGYEFEAHNVSKQDSSCSYQASSGLYVPPVRAKVGMDSKRRKFWSHVYAPITIGSIGTAIPILKGRCRGINDALLMIEDVLSTGEHVRECLRLFYAESKKVDIFSCELEEHVVTYFDVGSNLPGLPGGAYISRDQEGNLSVVSYHGTTTVISGGRFGKSLEALFSVYRLGGEQALSSARIG